nr:immunoglobulin heavy chain junction region [Homo sapiens]
LCGRGTYYL